MTYEEFVEKYCDGLRPTVNQELAIREVLRNEGATQWLMSAGRGAGKTTFRRWLVNYFIDQENAECGWDRWCPVPDPRFEK